RAVDSSNARAYHAGKLSLQGPVLTLIDGENTKACSITNRGLVCGNCTYTSPTINTKQLADSLAGWLSRPKRSARVALSKNKQIGRIPDFPGAIEGEYFGYLHNEKTGRYQLLRLKVNANY